MEATQKAWDLIVGKFNTWLESLITNLPNLVVAILIVIAFNMVAKTVRSLLHKALTKSLKNDALASLLGTVSQILILIIGLSVALGVLHLDKTVTSLLAGAGVIGIALGFAFQDIASNFISGIFIAFKEPYRIGDIIEVEGYLGVVKAVDLRTSLIETFDGIEIYIPNQYMFTKPLKNFSGEPVRRLEFEVGVSYADDLRQVEQVIKKALEPIEGRLPDRPVEVYFKEFDNSSINCDVRAWVSYPDNQNFFRYRHNAIIAIKEAFDREQITIPFPIRTLDFGIKGGEKLSQHLSH
jgi:small conductance mechanosensitive channel